jgi:hypothetical protein
VRRKHAAALSYSRSSDVPPKVFAVQISAWERLGLWTGQVINNPASDDWDNSAMCGPELTALGAMHTFGNHEFLSPR